MSAPTFRHPSSPMVPRLVTALALTALGVGALPPVQAQSPASIQVPVVAVGMQHISAGLALDGSLQAVRQSTLSAQTSGRITQLHVKAGDAIKAGQVLALIDDRSTQAAVAQTQAGVAQAEATRVNAHAHFERTRDLKAKGFLSQAVLDTAQAQLKSAQSGVAAARAAQTQSTLAHGFTRLTAPYDGWVLQTHTETGALALPGAPLLTVYAPQPIRAVVQVPASQQAQAQSAQRVEVQLPGSGIWVQPATQTRLPSADPVSQTVEWRLDLASKDGANQTPGTQVRVRFVGGESESTSAQRLVVPATALLRRGELTAVYVVTPKGNEQTEGFSLRAVRTGNATGEKNNTVSVVAGLKAGDRVALDPIRAGLAGAVPALH